jgi:hypothetical protein
MADEQILARLREHISKQFTGINQVTRGRIERLWLNAGSWRDADIERLSRQSWAIARAAMMDVAKKEASYQAAALASQTGRYAPAALLSTKLIELVVESPAARFAQPGAAIHTKLARGSSLKEAVEFGARQAAAIASRSLVDVRADQAAHSMATAGVTNYRRSLGGSACDYCRRVVGTGRKLYYGRPRPIHSSCDCGFEPVQRKVTDWEAQRQLGVSAKSVRQAQLTARKRGAEARRLLNVKQQQLRTPRGRS